MQAGSSGQRLVPVVTDAVFTDRLPSDAPVNVALMLVRHIAAPPRSRAPGMEMATKLKRRVEELREKRQASLVWSPVLSPSGSDRSPWSCGPRTQGTDGVWTGRVPPGAVELLFEEGTIRVHTRASLDGEGTRALLLDANGALLLQGTLNFFLHYLNPLVAERVEQAPYLDDDVLVPEILNRYLVQTVEWARGKMEAGARRVELFAAPLADRYGRQTVLRAVWQPEPPHICWQWEFEERCLAGYLEVRQATWVSGFITLIRLAYPDQWSWVSDREGGVP
ncbi:MAG: hypothetical protein U9R72_15640 [Chloroflexota bacterium]|nr:hypothetical protein [Chloroflexota bacterium]